MPFEGVTESYSCALGGAGKESASATRPDVMTLSHFLCPHPPLSPSRPHFFCLVSGDLLKEDVTKAGASWQSELSSSEIHLICLARGILTSPHLLVLHRPLAGLDDELATKVTAALRAFVDNRGHVGDFAAMGNVEGREARTVIFTCSMLEEFAIEAADNVVICGHSPVRHTVEYQVVSGGTLRRGALADRTPGTISRQLKAAYKNILSSNNTEYGYGDSMAPAPLPEPAPAPEGAGRWLEGTVAGGVDGSASAFGANGRAEGGVEPAGGQLSALGGLLSMRKNFGSLKDLGSMVRGSGVSGEADGKGRKSLEDEFARLL